MADSVPEVAHLAFYLAHGCAKISLPFLCFLGRPSPRSPAVDLAVAVILLLVLTAYLAGVILTHFTGVVLPYLNLSAPAPAWASCFAGLGRYLVMVFTLVFAWLLLIVVPLAAFYVFFGAGKRGISLGFSWNVLG